MLELKNVSFEVTEENNRKEIIFKPIPNCNPSCRKKGYNEHL